MQATHPQRDGAGGCDALRREILQVLQSAELSQLQAVREFIRPLESAKEDR